MHDCYLHNSGGSYLFNLHNYVEKYKKIWTKNINIKSKKYELSMNCHMVKQYMQKIEKLQLNKEFAVQNQECGWIRNLMIQNATLFFLYVNWFALGK